jgi:hypothetical protein
MRQKQTRYTAKHWLTVKLAILAWNTVNMGSKHRN